jgi:hypothetical protein
MGQRDPLRVVTRLVDQSDTGARWPASSDDATAVSCVPAREVEDDGVRRHAGDTLRVHELRVVDDGT